MCIGLVLGSLTNQQSVKTTPSGQLYHLKDRKRDGSLSYPCFKTALCYGAVSGCFVHGVSPSSRIRPKLAPKRGPGGPGLAFRMPESARKVHAKSFGPKCGLAGSKFASLAASFRQISFELSFRGKFEFFQL